jgi:Zn-dependent protease
MLFQTLLTDPLLFLSFIISLLIAITVHEASHAWTAFKLGDRTAVEYGRLTLNPLAHLDFMGSLFLLFFGFGWGKPVPTNPHNFKNPKKDEFLTAISGPISNFSLAIIFGLILRLAGSTVSENLSSLLALIIFINLILGLFNLIPIPPLDGSKILGLILPYQFYELLQRNGLWLLIGLLLLASIGLPVFHYLIYLPSQFLFQLITSLPIGFGI